MDDQALEQVVLIVDDDSANIDVLAEILSSYERRVAMNGEGALKIARSSSPPDLILLDIMMPQMDGHEVCRRLKADESTKHIPVIFVTAMGTETDEKLGFELGAVDYITKPFIPSIVKARVANHLALKFAYNKLEQQNSYISSMIDQSMDMIISLDTESKITTFNGSAEASFGYTAAEVLGRPIKDLLFDKRKFAVIYVYLKTNKKFSEEVLLESKNGETFPAILKISRLLDKNNNLIGAICNVRDLSDQKKLDQLLQEKRDLKMVKLAASTLNDVIRNNLSGILHLRSDAEEETDLNQEILDRFDLSVNEIVSFLDKLNSLDSLVEKKVAGVSVIDVDNRYD
ncbi:MAG: response regulator [Magnetococcales bacterium]|nr:response regulator [Magnetococcales bacterium]